MTNEYQIWFRPRDKSRDRSTAGTFTQPGVTEPNPQGDGKTRGAAEG